MSCDFLSTEVPGNHYCGNVLDIINEGWDLMIAHPPCTYISNAGVRFLYPGGYPNINIERFKKGMESVKFFMSLLNAPIHKICIENPIPSTAFCLPKRNQVIQPYQFGHHLQKKTYLWLKNLPHLKPSKIVEYAQSTKIPGNWFNKGGKDRQKNRAKTFQGIADAMANQWG